MPLRPVYINQWWCIFWLQNTFTKKQIDNLYEAEATLRDLLWCLPLRGLRRRALEHSISQQATMLFTDNAWERFLAGAPWTTQMPMENFRIFVSCFLTVRSMGSTLSRRDWWSILKFGLEIRWTTVHRNNPACNCAQSRNDICGLQIKSLR